MNKLLSLGAFILPIVFLFLLLILHIVKPEIEPWWRLISEYEIGQYSWLMRLNFVLLSVGALCLLLSLRKHISGTAGKIGLGLLGVATLGLLLGGLFITAPITMPRSDHTTVNIIHNIGGALMIFSSPFLIALTSWSLLKNNKWKTLKLPFLILSALSILSVLSFVVLTAVQYREVADSTMFMGLPNRTLIIAYCAWTSVVGWHLFKLAKR